MNNKKLYNIIIYSIIGILTVPTIAILATWNTLPGEKLYPVKVSLEKIAAAIASPSYAARSELELQLLERRISENEMLFADLSTAGLDELTAQALSAKELILLRKKGADPEIIQQFVIKLRQANTRLEAQKRQISSTQPTIITQTQTIIETTTIIQEVQVPGQPQPTPQPEPEEVIEEIEETQEEIEEIIEELEEAAEEENGETEEPTVSSPSTPAPTTEPKPIISTSQSDEPDDSSDNDSPGQSGDAPGHNKDNDD